MRVPHRIVTALALFLTVGTAVAQSQGPVTIRQLESELAKRDAVIIKLLNRMQALESKLSGVNSGNGVEPDEAMVAAPVSNSVNTAESGRRANSGFDIDALAAERALERSLVQQGARLLNPGQIEIVPGFSYSRIESDTPALIAMEGAGFVGDIHREVDVLDLNTAFRVGLPFDSQLEINIPYRRVEADSLSRIEGAVQSTTDDSGGALGDISVTLAARLLEEESWLPTVIGRIGWQADTGEAEDNGVALGGGNEAWNAQLSLSWRRDPLVFLLGGGYTHYSDHDGLVPGDAANFSLGTALAVSPETALTFSLDQRFSREFSLDGDELSGTDRLSSVFNISTTTILGRGILLRLNAGIGLTEDAPDYQIGFAMPFHLEKGGVTSIF